MRTTLLSLIALACSAGLAAAAPQQGYTHPSPPGYGKPSTSVKHSTSLPSSTHKKTTKTTSKPHTTSTKKHTSSKKTSSKKSTKKSTTSKCSVTTTSTLYVSSTVTTGPITTVTYFGAGPIIDGDALTPTSGTATAKITGFTTNTIQTTTTITDVTFPVTTVGTFSTHTIPTSKGFLPVQDTLPNATYHYSNPCDVSTVTTTSIDYQIFEGPAVTTLTGTIITFSAKNTYYPASAFTNFSIVYDTTTTYTDTEYLGTATTTVQATITNTVTATTTTVYAACATNNFADSVIVDHLPEQITFFDTESSANQSFSGVQPGPQNPFDCCNYAFDKGSDVWVYAVGIGCAIVTGTDGLCTPAQTNDTAEVHPNPGQGALQIILGNAQCGRFNASIIPEF